VGLAGALVGAAACRLWLCGPDRRLPGPDLLPGWRLQPGSAQLVVLPPGYVCTWTKEQGGLDAKQGPGSLPSIYLATMAGTGLALVKWRPARSERLRASVFEPETDRG
jgi:hypothetical protein